MEKQQLKAFVKFEKTEVDAVNYREQYKSAVRHMQRSYDELSKLNILDETTLANIKEPQKFFEYVNGLTGTAIPVSIQEFSHLQRG